jgi:hypothetical protein
MQRFENTSNPLISIGPIGHSPQQPRRLLPEGLQETPGAVAVLCSDRRDHHCKEQPRRTDKKIAHSAFDR